MFLMQIVSLLATGRLVTSAASNGTMVFCTYSIVKEKILSLLNLMLIVILDMIYSQFSHEIEFGLVIVLV